MSVNRVRPQRVLQRIDPPALPQFGGNIQRVDLFGGEAFGGENDWLNLIQLFFLGVRVFLLSAFRLLLPVVPPPRLPSALGLFFPRRPYDSRSPAVSPLHNGG